MMVFGIAETTGGAVVVASAVVVAPDLMWVTVFCFLVRGAIFWLLGKFSDVL